MSQELIQAMTEMREEDALKITQQMLDAGKDPLEVLDACHKAMDIIGKRFEAGEYFIPELILAGEMLNQVTEMIKPHLKQEAAQKKNGKIVIGTVEGDIHDIAKNIVAFMLDINGYDVDDLGVDVPPSTFVETAKATGAKVVALSGFLTLAFDPMKATVEALKKAGLKDVRVMIGGGQIDEQIRQFTGADGWGRNAMDAVKMANQWYGVKGS